jgi:hypothetical protein
VDFLTLSLPEASALYMGLAIQHLVRASSLRAVPGTMVLVWCFVLLWRGWGRPGGYKALLGYAGTSVLLILLFWPEATGFGRLTPRTTAADQIASYAAAQDPGATVVTAADTQQVPQALQQPALIPPGYRLLLRAITETPLALARTINSQAHRTFSSTMPMHWLLGTELTTDVTTAIADWVHNCYLPVQMGTMEAQSARTLEAFLPWGNTPLRQGLATRDVVPGAQTGITWLRGPTPGNTVRCDVYLDAVEFRTQAWLYELRSPRGTPLTEVFFEELGLDSQQQARFLVYREMLRAAGPAVPAPSLAGTYAALRGLSVAGKAVDVGSFTGVVGWLSGAFSFGTTLFGAARGGAAGLSAEFQRVIDGLSWIVGMAAFLTWWAPYIIGLINLVLVALLPFVLLWALIPGTQFQPLASYVVALLFTNAAPLWWALIDQAQRLAGSTAPQSHDPILGLGNAATAFLWSHFVTVLGILVIPVITGMVFFAVFRAVGSLWRGAV